MEKEVSAVDIKVVNERENSKEGSSDKKRNELMEDISQIAAREFATFLGHLFKSIGDAFLERK